MNQQMMSFIAPARGLAQPPPTREPCRPLRAARRAAEARGAPVEHAEAEGGRNAAAAAAVDEGASGAGCWNLEDEKEVT